MLFRSVQHDYTLILSCLIQTFPNQLEFKDWVQLTHCHDPEMDFFENMKHIQVGAADFLRLENSSSYNWAFWERWILGFQEGFRVLSLVFMTSRQICM